MISQNKFKEALSFLDKSIKIEPNNSNAYYNLGIVYRYLGEISKAEFNLKKSIQLNPELTKSYYVLSTINPSTIDSKLREYLFSDMLINKSNVEGKINIYMSRANIMHKEKSYHTSSKYLILANNLKLSEHESNINSFFTKADKLFFESKNINEIKSHVEYKKQMIFIVGMFRSGSTLIESILDINEKVFSLGEVNLFEDSYMEWKKKKSELDNIYQIYLNKIKLVTNNSSITTDKNLYNFLYTEIICKNIPNAKIIHCFRNPLDNILSIYRTHIAEGSTYTSSLVDIAKILLYQEKVMTKYKKRFRSNIYDVNYDLLTSNPNQEIKDLIYWLGWEWDDSYLSPHLNQRSVSTASSVQVRSPINSKSINGWKNYKEMLKPAIEILTKTDKYRDLT